GGGGGWEGGGGGERRRSVSGGQGGPAAVYELDDMRQRREVAQLELVVTRDVVGLPNRREGLGLLHGVDPEVGLEVEVERQHVGRVAEIGRASCRDRVQHLVLGRG